ncbi:MAG: putative toxin-antitoxin system toxin component, PIN family [Gemmatimonadota bacterium]|uniref:putative toxin-antitoxin system toxin component, PIN family n=1 Tax=Candidatus Palauibacter scopulicola TaxID=3056741 RepID=UPI0023896AAC|nr:putative toxin-antitoxin system toxin component, PIN family [Candidatus Palauibacter scopulicola]MDE2662994.1 putative toxin-antitoxin system toxin component, PIN family [Candidatus Palauibacter scopulicola]
MTPAVFVVDTNVVVSALITSDATSPTAIILDAMLDGGLLYLMSEDLIAEYAAVLRRPALVRRHGLNDRDIDQLLTELTANAIWCEPAAGGAAPDAGDDHLWALLASHSGSRLVTGDRLLVDNPPPGTPVLTPRDLARGERT